MTTFWLVSDEAIFEIWDAFQVINRDYYFACGIMIPVFVLRQTQRHEPENVVGQRWFNILTDQNDSYESRREQLERGITDLLDNW